MSTATLEGLGCTFAKVSIPAWGIPWAEVTLSTDATLTGQVTLKVKDLTMVCTVVSGGPAIGKAHYRLCAGAGGWGRMIPPKAYSNDFGVKLRTVLQDAAERAGETLDLDSVTDTKLGSHYARDEGPASRVFNNLASKNWYVGLDGITRFGQREQGPLTVQYQAGPIDRSRGQLTLAADTISEIVPGRTAEGLTIVDVTHEVSREGGLRSHVYGSIQGGSSRRLTAMAALVRELVPDMRYRGITEYRVVSQEGDRLNLQSTSASSGMPDLERVPQRFGIPGVKAEPTLGSRVLVSFIGGDPSRPFVCGYEPPDGSGFEAISLELGGADDPGVTIPNAAGRVVRYGDTIVMPVGAGATPTEMVVTILTPQSLSRVRG